MSAARWLAALATAAALAVPLFAAAQPVEALRESKAAPLRVVPRGATGDKLARMCGVCHSEIRVKYDKGAHKSEGVGCVSCHGGDPNAITVEAAHRGNFRGVPPRRSIPGLCASCHADVAKMRFYNLPSDQYALYQTSEHGIMLAKGDTNVAVCTDCHGVHEIRPTDDPKSSVFKRNIHTTCGSCHGDKALMKKYGRSGNVVAEYTEGEHGRAFLEDGNDAAPECTRCHGSHGATPPGVGDAQKVCGQCHAKTRTYFLAGPHADALNEEGRRECAACHDDHKTAPATIEMLDTACGKCHDAETEEMRVAARLKTMLVGASDEIGRAEKLIEEAARIPLYVDDYRARLENARTALLESYPVMHTVDTTKVEPHTRRARSIAAEIGSEIHEKLAGRLWHKIGLGIFWFYLLLTAAILTRSRRRAAAEKDR